ncbi:MAG: hypothetical protein H7Z42_18550, partial [Roseiflexaceae bacterium]|nr:hypothetical protein [Roseiflexaceae bacterium]
VGALLGAPLVAISAAALLLLPGLALLRWLWPDPLALSERWPLAIGLSCAALPLLLLASSLVGLRWSGPLCWAWLAICALAAFWPARTFYHEDTKTRREEKEEKKSLIFVAGSPVIHASSRLRAFVVNVPAVLLLATTALALALRLFVARDLPTGMFGDSYHHTVITQLLIDHGGLFSSWQPYAALRTFTYHYGLHSVAATLALLSGLPAAASLLITGQILSALAAPLVYLLTLRLLRHQASALVAALLIAVISTMPAFYVNWGRYTQIAGQTILVSAAVIWMALLDWRITRPAHRAAGLRLLALAVVASAGLVLTHYRVAVFAACFVAAYALYRVLTQPGWLDRRRAVLGFALIGLAAGALTLAVVAPWLLRLREGALLRIGGYYIANNLSSDAGIHDIFGLIVAPWLLGLALLGLALLLARREWRGLVLVGWFALMWLAANPYLLGLNGTGLLTSFAVLLAVYLIVAPLAGAGIALGVEWLFDTLRRPWMAGPATLALGALLLGWGLGGQQRMLAPQNQLVFPADVVAMNWIRAELPPDARFFVSSFGAYGGGVFAGSDAGWWLPFLSGRASNLPPITYGTEAGETPDYQLSVKIDNEAIMAHPIGSPEAAAALKAAGYTHLYDGPGNTAPAGQEYVSAAQLAGSPLYEIVYNTAGVSIWRIR